MKTKKAVIQILFGIGVMLSILFVGCTNSSTFIVTDIVAPDNFLEKEVQEAKDKVIGAEVRMLFSDNDVRLTISIKEESESFLMQKVGDNLYRIDDGSDVMDLELNTIFGFIKSAKIAAYDKRHNKDYMDWGGTIILERK